jgi:hypothetical protein
MALSTVLTYILQIVDKKSATLNLAGTREKTVPSNADHSSICKFASEDMRFELAIETIVSEMQRALEERATLQLQRS